MPNEERNEPHKKPEIGQERERKDAERREHPGEPNVQKQQGVERKEGEERERRKE